MSNIVVTTERASAIVAASVDAGLRLPTQVIAIGPPPQANRTLVYTPDFTVAEQATFDRLAKTASGTALLSPADYAALETRLANIRLFRQQTRNEFIAKTVDQRDRELFDATTDLIAIVLRLLRD